MPMSPKRKKQLNADRGVFKDFPVQQWTEYRPYTNSSVAIKQELKILQSYDCLLYTSPSPRDRGCSRMPSSA